MRPERWWERWGPLSGVVFVALMIISFAVAGDSPSNDDSDAKIAAFVGKHSEQVRNIVGFFIVLAAALFLLAFFAALRSRLVQEEAGSGRLGALAFGAGIASAVFLFAAISLFVSPLLLANDAEKFPPDPGIYRITQTVGYEFWIASTVFGAVVVWATSAVVLQTRFLPRWFAWFGIVAGVIGLFAVFFFPIFVFWLWIIVAAILFVVRPSTARTGGTEPGQPVVG